MKSTTAAIPFLLLWALRAPFFAAAQQSSFSSRMSFFTRSLTTQLQTKTIKGSAIAIADFDNMDDASRSLNLGYAVSEIATKSHHGVETNVLLNGVKLEAALMLYF